MRIAFLSFGGPAGQIALMHRILVDEKRWIGEARFLHALNFCMLLPGPEAQQLATYIGWLLHGVRGGLIAGGLFILPGASAMLGLSFLYVLYGDAEPIEALFFGLQAAVLAIVLQAVMRIGGKALRSGAACFVAATAFVAIFFLGVAFPVVILGAGLIGWFAGRRGSSSFAASGHGPARGDRTLAAPALTDDAPGHDPRRARRAAAILAVAWLLPLGAIWLLAPSSVWSEIALFFSRMAVVTFGGAYAVLAYVAQTGVDTYDWLRPEEMLDGLGLAETTPGPLIIVTQFVGFLAALRATTGLDPLLAATLGAALATWVTFMPCFVWIFAGAPFIERLRAHRALASALGAITAAVVGVILNLALWFALHFLFGSVASLRTGPFAFELPVMASLDPIALMLALFAIGLLIVARFGVITTLASCALAAITIRSLSS